jgi:hypothetical protein
LLKNVIQRKLQPDTGAENGGFSLKKWGLQPCSHGGFSFENEDLIMLTVEALNLEGDFIHDHIQDRTCRPLQEELWKAQFPVRYG